MRKSRPTSRQPDGPAPGWSTAARVVLLVHLALSPLVFWRRTLEVFEANKVALLLLCALALAGLGLCALADSAARGLGVGKALARAARDLFGAPVAVGALLFAASAAVSTAVSVSPRTSLQGAHESYAGLGTVVALVVLFLATRALFRNVDDAYRVLAVVPVCTAGLSAYALLQAAGADPLNWAVTAAFAGWVRPFATLGHPNFLAAYLVMALPLLTPGIAHAFQAGRRWSALLLALVGVLGCAAVVATLSRGAWLAGGCAGAVLVLRGARRRWLSWGLPAAALLLVGAGVGLGLAGRPPGEGELGGAVRARLRQLTDAEGRPGIWRASWGLFRGRPLTGWGLDTFQIAYGMGRPPAPLGPEWDHTPARAHNEVLHVLATQGLLGAAALLVLAAGLAWAAVRAWSRGPDRLLAAALAGSVLAFCVQDLFSFTVAGCAVLFVTVAGLLSRLGEPTGEGAREAPAGARWDAGAVVFGALLGFLVVLGNVADDSAPAAARRWVGCAVVGLALALSALAAVRPSRWTGGAGLLSPAPAWLRLVQAGVGVAALGAAWEWVLPPVLADRACLEGDQLLAEAPARALACYERAVGLAPGRDVYWFKLGAAAQASAGSADDRERRGRLVRARQALEQACALVPASPDHHANLARLRALLASEGLAEPDGAFNEFDAALAGDPFNTLFLADAGQSAAALGLKERARRYLRRGLELDPTLPALEVGVATLALQEGRLTEAEGHLAKAAGSARWQDEEARWQGVALLGLARLRLRRFEEARRLADMVLEQRPAWVHVRLTRAEALEGLGRKAEAADEYRRVVALAPGFGPARAALVRLTTGP